jgi:hypothetical protein
MKYVHPFQKHQGAFEAPYGINIAVFDRALEV